jgi:sugar phosphate isomerase/epimerase
MRCALLSAATLIVIGSLESTSTAADPDQKTPVFARQNLVAWCIVPFDAAKRGPRERAELLQQLGVRRFAYDWRDEHVATFEEEIRQLQGRGIEFFAFWSFHPDFVPLVAKHNIHPQFWITAPSPDGATQADKLNAAAAQLAPLVKQTRELGCRLGLYNHGGWGGEPANLVAVVKQLRAAGQADHVGIVYNLHHGHEHIRDFAEVLSAMQPYLLCLNLNGMNDRAEPKILPVGSGQHDRAMLDIIRASDYSGPIGILGHRAELDAAESLRLNLDGLKKLLQQIGDEAWKTYE